MSSDGIDTRSKILDAAWKLLEEGKGNGVRMSDIAKAAGISRQAVYLHFPSRAELLTETTRHIDRTKNIEARLLPSRTARNGRERINAFVEAWGNYIPEIYGVVQAILAMKDTDPEAATAWADRMRALREGCESAIRDLKRDGTLTPSLTEKEAVDMLWTLLSVRTWEHLRIDCGWPQKRYIAEILSIARKTLLARWT
ncbi:TetR/AcrR family transcriptional regulator [Rhodospirillaceae bacterium KN72]|uniref:TetR/AcrR family transcriptional regulator n=1 Tax=Pacificispira spongiicola TaxID=2729598 RepID=A0A7Y0HG95_9PROT|nr:TetR/AcrR family transcriptional regulator [Pacificispira spongiicola]NMM44109.1 TetR/AcrR family transcriptional regulator [Pacificispira spongiicola]